MEDKINIQKEAKLIFNMGVARKLLQAGCIAIDCKPDRTNKDKTVIVFRNDEKFKIEFAKINDELKAKEGE